VRTKHSEDIDATVKPFRASTNEQQRMWHSGQNIRDTDNRAIHDRCCNGPVHGRTNCISDFAHQAFYKAHERLAEDHVVGKIILAAHDFGRECGRFRKQPRCAKQPVE
jgi:hypothetical protein